MLNIHLPHAMKKIIFFLILIAAGCYVYTTPDILEKAKQALFSKEKPRKKSHITKEEALKELIQAGVIQTEEDVESMVGMRALFNASSEKKTHTARKLIAAGVNVNARLDEGKTPLVQAAYAGNVAMVKMLIHAGADVNYVSDNGLNILMHALQGGDNEKVVDALLSAGADPTYRSRWGSDTMGHAKHLKRVKAINLLKEKGISE